MASILTIKFCASLEAMIRDENKAFPEYSKLMREAEGAGVKESDLGKIANNRYDEKQHEAILRNIRSKYCKVK